MGSADGGWVECHVKISVVAADEVLEIRTRNQEGGGSSDQEEGRRK